MFYPFHYIAISDGTFHHPQEMKFPAINTHSLLSTSTQFLLKQRYPRGVRKHARLSFLCNWNEKFCLFYNLLLWCTNYATCFYN